jgi:hypothetical protein
MTRATSKALLAMTLKQLRAHLKEYKDRLSFSTLSRYRKTLLAAAGSAANSEPPAADTAADTADTAAADTTAADTAKGQTAQDQDKKARAVYAVMRERVEAGATVRRRKAGTGAKTEIQLVYRDTPANRKLNRVGVAYTKTVYENAEVEEVARKLRRPKRATDPSRKRSGNAWIRAVIAAKADLGAPSFLIIRRESNDPEDIGVKVYNRAKQIMEQQKAEAAAPPAEPVAA